jgi:hypothetical protein
MAFPCARLRPLSAALLGLTLTAGIAGPLPAQAAVPGPTRAGSRTATAAVSTTPLRGAVARPAKGLSMQKLIEYWGANARGINSEFADMQAAGATWARVSLPYGAAGAAGMARVVSAARAHHVRLIVVLGKPGNQKDIGTAANRAAYRSWVTGTVRRFKASVKYWEVLNEPNLRSSWAIDNRAGSNQAVYAGAVRRYVTLLADGYRSVKAADRTAVVLFGGLSESTVERYLGVLLTTSAWRYFDVMSFHPFGRTPALVTARYTAFSTRLHSRPLYARKPIWVTEVGYNTSWTNKGGYVPNEALKARYLTDSMRRLYASTRRPVLWHTLHGANPANTGYGLEIKNKAKLTVRRLPAFTAFRTL